MVTRCILTSVVLLTGIHSAIADTSSESAAIGLERLQETVAEQTDALELLQAQVLELSAREKNIDGPKIAYDSGWHSLGRNQSKTLYHNVGGNTDRYIVLMDMASNTYGQTNLGYGVCYPNDGPTGMDYRHLTNSSITVWRQPADAWVTQFRVRIVKY